MAADLHESGHRMSVVTQSGPVEASNADRIWVVRAAVAAVVFFGFMFLHWRLADRGAGARGIEYAVAGGGRR
jgi:hypothetical protein